jgi:tetratricopeptide (TPR) repeat protein
VVMRSREAGEYAYAHIMSKSGHTTTAARVNPRVNALFHARVAHGYGYRGELGMAQRSLGRARDALARVTPDTPTPPWLRYFNRAELAALAALTYQALGRYQQASEQGELATSEVLPGYVRNRTLYTLGLADSLLSEREVEQAAAQATAGLDLAGQLREGVHRGRVAGRLRQLRGRFGHWPDVPEARAWVAAYDGACSLDAPPTPPVATSRPGPGAFADRASHAQPCLAVSR